MLQTLSETQKASLAQLEKLTQISFKTLVKRLADVEPIEVTAREKYYPLGEALRVVYKPSLLDLNKERARLAKYQGDKVKLEVQEMKGMLIDSEKWLADYSQKITGFKDKMLALPLKLAGEVSICSDVEENRMRLTSAVYEALNDLAFAQKGNYEAQKDNR